MQLERGQGEKMGPLHFVKLNIFQDVIGVAWDLLPNASLSVARVIEKHRCQLNQAYHCID